MVVSVDLFREIHTHVVDDDSNQFIRLPIIHLSDERVKILMKIADMLADIASFDIKDLHLRHQLLSAQLFVGCEFLYQEYREQEQMKGLSAHTALYYHFCDLVVKHHRESREVKYYAEVLFSYINGIKHYLLAIAFTSYRRAKNAPSAWPYPPMTGLP